MTDCNIVEMLLFFGIPYKDTNELAHRLIAAFGDLKGVLNAPVNELMKIDGMGENSATLISFVRDIAARYNSDAVEPILPECNRTALAEYLVQKYAGIDDVNEVFSVVSLDTDGSVKNFIKVCDGYGDFVTVDNRRIIEIVIALEAKLVIIAHNHPSGTPFASPDDAQATEIFKGLLSSVGTQLADHAIIADGKCIFMSEIPEYSHLFKDR